MFRVGDRVHPNRFVPGVANGTVTTIRQVHNLATGVSYQEFEVEYDKPVQGVWPYLNHKRYRGYYSAESLSRI